MAKKKTAPALTELMAGGTVVLPPTENAKLPPPNARSSSMAKVDSTQYLF